MFTVQSEPFDSLTLYRLRNEETGECAAIVGDYGAILHRLSLLTDNDQLIQVIDGYETAEQLLAEGSRSFRGTLLFPFPNRVRDGRYAFDGQSYQLPVNEIDRGHALHGHLYHAPFEVVAEGASETGAFLILEYEADGKAEGYPFKYLLNLDFRLDEAGFSCKTVIQNLEERDIPVGIGYHPYFQLGDNADEWLLKLPVESQLEIDDRLIPNGEERIPARYQEFASLKGDVLDNAYRVRPTEGEAITQLVNPGQNVTLTVWQRTGPGQFNYLQVFTPESRRSIALEPMTGAPDAFNNGQGLIRLAPDQILEATFGVRVE
ncbi:MAG: hypothetical protein H7Z75_13455 [Ferruginibacter sp.]|nr:hypothetical protein [Cytophagales bacterium]